MKKGRGEEGKRNKDEKLRKDEEFGYLKLNMRKRFADLNNVYGRMHWMIG